MATLNTRQLDFDEERALAGRLAGVMFLTGGLTAVLLLFLPGIVDHHWEWVVALGGVCVAFGLFCLVLSGPVAATPGCRHIPALTTLGIIAGVMGALLARMGKEVTVLFDYDSSVRGSMSDAFLIFDDEPIANPVVEEADIMLKLADKGHLRISGRKVVADLGLDVAAGRMVKDAAGVGQVADELGAPVAIKAVAPAVLISFMAAYAIVRAGHTRFLQGVNLLFLAGLAVPLQAVVIPVYLIIIRLQLYDTLLAIILPSIAFAIPLSVLVLANFIRDVPKELFEAMRIDGASEWMTMWRLAAPLTSTHPPVG